ncbi:MAG: alpha/beta hydrolase [Caldilinea sp.]|nr:alpha/beta hydrolase [Caldilinea sp.]MDW8440438.1 alpha/beta hydrolase [Caldilineaceae bacterium]
MEDVEARSLLTVEAYRRLPLIPAGRRWFYGPHAGQFGDLYLPSSSGPHPVVALIHGGCWQAEFGLEPLGQLAQTIAAHGAAVWNIEYRRLGEGGGWPTTFQDVGAALDFLRTLADVHALDLHRVIACGHSAGGHLALWLAGRTKLPADSLLFTLDPLPLRGVLSIAGIPDLAAAAERSVCDGAIIDLLGGVPDEVPNRYACASPVVLTPLGVPHIHLHGRNDAVVPIDLVETYVQFAVHAGDDARLMALENTGHFEPVDARTPAAARVIETLRAMWQVMPET